MHLLYAVQVKPSTDAKDRRFFCSLHAFWLQWCPEKEKKTHLRWASQNLDKPTFAYIDFSELTEPVMCVSSGSDGRGCAESLEADPDDVQDAKPSQGDLLRDSLGPVSQKHIVNSQNMSASLNSHVAFAATSKEPTHGASG